MKAGNIGASIGGLFGGRRTRTLKPDQGNRIPNDTKKAFGLPHQGAAESARRLRQIAAGNRQDLPRR